MAETILLSSINKRDTWPKIIQVSAPNSCGTVSIIIDDTFTPQMLYELPAITINIYLVQNEEYVLYDSRALSISATNNLKSISSILTDIPKSCVFSILPNFDKYAFDSHNNDPNILNVDIWKTPTEVFPVKLVWNNSNIANNNTSEDISGTNTGNSVVEIPIANADNVDKIIQYVGNDTDKYISGYFYKCVEKLDGTYDWQNIDVQASNTLYELPAAGTDTLGGIKVGKGLNIDDDGVLAVNMTAESLSTVAITGSYNDLINKPPIDTQINENSTNAVQNSAIYSYVNSSISTATADFKGTHSSLEELKEVEPIDNNDYGFVISTDDDGNTIYSRYKYDGTEWIFEYNLNNSSYTATEWAAIQSGMTSADKDNFVNHMSNNSNPHAVTKDQVGLGNIDNTADVDKPISNATQIALNLKVDKVDGKMLSTNDFTDTYKVKLDSLENYDDTDVKADVAEVSNQAAINKSTLGYQRKNLLLNKCTARTTNGITAMVNADKSVTFSGNSTVSGTNIIFFNLQTGYNGTNEQFYNNKKWIPNGKYILSVEADGMADDIILQVLTSTDNSASTTKILKTLHGAGETLLEIKDADNYVWCRLGCEAGANFVDGVTIYPMIRYAKITDDTYEPYQPSVQEQIDSLTNHVDTEIAKTTEQVALNRSTLGYQRKNLLLNKCSDKTTVGVTATVNVDGSITLNGTNSTSSTKIFYWNMQTGYTGEAVSGQYTGNKKWLPNGKYISSGVVAGVSLQMVFSTDNASEARYVSTGANGTAEFEVTDADKYVWTRLRIAANASLDNVTVYPMIRPADVTDATYEPYKPSIQEQIDNTKSDTQNNTNKIAELESRINNYHSTVIYGYHIDANESDSDVAVSYIAGAVGMTPAKMGATTFDYGSWKNAFFMPKPCMLRYDGTVAYYLDPNDYTKKIDGTPSDVENPEFEGNAMMEWGQIWYKFAGGEADGEGYFYVSNQQVDESYHCWCNYDANDNITPHFYTYIYNSTLHNGKFRSLSGYALTQANGSGYTSGTQEITYCTANNTTNDIEWYTDVYSDRLLINALLVLMGKSINTQATFGRGLDTGNETAKNAYITGSLNNKGLFWGNTSAGTSGVKVFGMENWWGCVWHRTAGCVSVAHDYKIKLTYGTADGTTVTGYNSTGNGYISTGNNPSTNGYIKKFKYSEYGYMPFEVGGSSTTYYGDYYYQSTATYYLLVGGNSGYGVPSGAFYFNLATALSASHWHVSAGLSCKPLA